MEVVLRGIIEGVDYPNCTRPSWITLIGRTESYERIYECLSACIVYLRTPWQVWAPAMTRLVGPTVPPNQAVRPFKSHHSPSFSTAQIMNQPIKTN